MFKGATNGIVAEAILNRAPEPLRHLVQYDGLELERIANLALQKDRSLRYQTAAGIRADLLAYKSRVGTGQVSSSPRGLEEMFEPDRLKDTHVPGGWSPPGPETRAITGHPFGLNLTAGEREQLIAFLRTL